MLMPTKLLASSRPLVQTQLESVMLGDGAVCLWRCDSPGGNAALLDLSGNYADLGLLATPTAWQAPFSTGIPYAINYGGVGQHRGLTNVTAIDNFSTEVILKLNGLPAGNAWWIRNGNAAVTTGWGVGVSSAGKIGWVANNNGVNFSSGTTLATGTLYHIVVYREGGIWKAYLNNAVDTANMGSTAPSAFSTSDFMTVSGVQNGTEPINANIAYAAVYQRVLTAAQVANHWSLIS